MAYLEVKGQLAKLLATENLNVVHDPNVDTASFNTASRTLTLPLLFVEDEHVYNMFIGHEVGHALETPVDWHDKIDEDIPFDFVNVIEDVRIERHIQERFPGLRKDFTRGYHTLDMLDFFDISGKQLERIKFIDRINLHFKLGALALIPFTEREQQIVDRIARNESFEDVVESARVLVDYLQQVRDEEDEEEVDWREGGTEEGDEDGEGNPYRSDTQVAFDEAMGKQANKKTVTGTAYVRRTPNPLEKIIRIDEQRSSLQQWYEEHPNWFKTHSVGPECIANFHEFLASIKSDVNYMVQQFEMKKSADAYRRAQTHRTGKLDTEKLHLHKLTDDLFLKQTVVPEGKSHGLVMLLDWSGSMGEHIPSTVKQIILLAEFCRKVNIHYEVHSFMSNGWTDDEYELRKEIRGELSTCGVRLCERLVSGGTKKQHRQDMLMLWLDAHYANKTSPYMPHSSASAMGGTPLNNVLLMIPEILEDFKKRTGAQKLSFVALTDGDSCATFVHNDRGVTHHHAYEHIFVRDGGSILPLLAGEQSKHTGMIARWLSNRFPEVSFTNIFMGGAAAVQRYLRCWKLELDTAHYRKHQAQMFQSDYWEHVGVVNPNQFNNELEEIPVEAGETDKTVLKRALKKYLRGKKTSRIFLDQLVANFT